jgi:hypothetical protein
MTSGVDFFLTLEGMLLAKNFRSISFHSHDRLNFETAREARENFAILTLKL